MKFNCLLARCGFTRPALLLALLLASLGGALAPAAPAEVAPADLLQFRSAGHVLGFAPGGMYVSNGSYALHVEFVGANAAAPQAAEPQPAAGGKNGVMGPCRSRCGKQRAIWSPFQAAFFSG